MYAESEWEVGFLVTQGGADGRAAGVPGVFSSAAFGPLSTCRPMRGPFGARPLPSAVPGLTGTVRPAEEDGREEGAEEGGGAEGADGDAGGVPGSPVPAPTGMVANGVRLSGACPGTQLTEREAGTVGVASAVLGARSRARPSAERVRSPAVS